MALTASTMLPLQTRLPSFKATDAVSGTVVKSSDFQNSKGLVVMFICNHCPYVKHIQKELAQFASDYQKKGIAFVAVNSNDVEKYPDDGPDLMKIEALEYGYTFAYLLDESQSIAKDFKAACTPDFFLFDSQQKLVYRGQFDSSRPGKQIAVTGEDLKKACELLLRGNTIPDEQTPSIGCNIKWRKGNEPAYFNH